MTAEAAPARVSVWPSHSQQAGPAAASPTTAAGHAGLVCAAESGRTRCRAVPEILPGWRPALAGRLVEDLLCE